MNNVNKLKLNSIIGLINQIALVLSGLILPRFILSYFGSDINGLTASINQFLSIIAFLELGVGSVAQSSLYKPISSNNNHQINVILSTAKKFFRSLAFILSAYVILLMVFFPIFTDSPLDYFGTSFLIFAMSISLFAQYYFGLIYQLYLNANQKNYIPSMASIVTVTLNMIFSVLLIANGAPIQLVKLATSLIYLLRPMFFMYYVKKKYTFVSFNMPADSQSIPQKWNGIAQHIAYTVMNSTDMVILTIFSTLKNVSIYSIHILVINGVKLLITSLANGMQPFFGDLLAKEEIEKLNKYFTYIEWILHTLVTFSFGMAAVLLNSFVLIYTRGVHDTNYDVPLFALLIVIAQAVYCLRLPYNAIVIAGGHFRQTQNASIIEALINIVISIIAIRHFGLIGVAIGTLLAMSYKILYLVVYLSNNLIYRSIDKFFKHLLTDMVCFSLVLIVWNVLNFSPINFIEWLGSAIVTGVIYLVFCILINYILYKDKLLYFLKRMIKK